MFTLHVLNGVDFFSGTFDEDLSSTGPNPRDQRGPDLQGVQCGRCCLNFVKSDALFSAYFATLREKSVKNL